MDLNHRIEQWLVSTQQDFHASAPESERRRRPHVTLSYAQSWDGSITTSPGQTLALSSDASMQLTHQLRSLHDGILVGIGTVLADNPQLTVREWAGSDPQPIVLDSQLRMPTSSNLCQSDERRCWILTTVQDDSDRDDCELVRVSGDGSGQVNLKEALEALYTKGIRSLMVEGGASVITAFVLANLADAIVLTVAPMLIGGYKAIDELHGESQSTFPRISPLFSQQLDDEVIVWGQLRYGAAQS